MKILVMIDLMSAVAIISKHQCYFLQFTDNFTSDNNQNTGRASHSAAGSSSNICAVDTGEENCDQEIQEGCSTCPHSSGGPFGVQV